MSSSYGASIINENPNEDRDPPTKIDDIQIKNLKLFICFNSVVLGGAAVLVTMMMIGYNSVEYSKGRDFLLVASVITGIFMFLLVTFAILMLFGCGFFLLHHGTSTMPIQRQRQPIRRRPFDNVEVLTQIKFFTLILTRKNLRT